MFSKLWNDEAGFVTLEYLLGATILVLGLIVGLTSLRNAVVVELSELGAAIGSLSQNYSFAGLTACSSSTDGSGTTSLLDVPLVITLAAQDPSAPGAINLAVCP